MKLASYRFDVAYATSNGKRSNRTFGVTTQPPPSVGAFFSSGVRGFWRRLTSAATIQARKARTTSEAVSPGGEGPSEGERASRFPSQVQDGIEPGSPTPKRARSAALRPAVRLKSPRLQRANGFGRPLRVTDPRFEAAGGLHALHRPGTLCSGLGLPFPLADPPRSFQSPIQDASQP